MNRNFAAAASFAVLIVSVFIFSEPQIVKHSANLVPVEDDVRLPEPASYAITASPSAASTTKGPLGTVDTQSGALQTAPPKVESLVKFNWLAKKTLAGLPTTVALRKLPPEEFHETPRLIRQAGKELGAIAQWLEDEPSLKPAGALFYQACFQREDIASSVRALCLSNHRALREAAGDPEGWSEEENKVHAEVKRLAAFLLRR